MSLLKKLTNRFRSKHNQAQKSPTRQDQMDAMYQKHAFHEYPTMLPTGGFVLPPNKRGKHEFSDNESDGTVEAGEGSEVESSCATMSTGLDRSHTRDSFPLGDFPPISRPSDATNDEVMLPFSPGGSSVLMSTEGKDGSMEDDFECVPLPSGVAIVSVRGKFEGCDVDVEDVVVVTQRDSTPQSQNSDSDWVSVHEGDELDHGVTLMAAHQSNGKPTQSRVGGEVDEDWQCDMAL